MNLSDSVSSFFFFLMHIPCIKNRASSVCRKWKQGADESLARKERLSFSGWMVDDDSITRLVGLAYGLKELDM